MISIVCGSAAAVFSVAHYITAKNHLRGDVPLQFGVNGRPQLFVRPKLFIVYPALVVGEFVLLLYSIRLLRAAKPLVDKRRPDHVLSAVINVILRADNAAELRLNADSLLLAMPITVCAQVYAGMVSAGTRLGMPKYLPAVLLATVLIPFAAHKRQ